MLCVLLVSAYYALRVSALLFRIALKVFSAALKVLYIMKVFYLAFRLLVLVPLGYCFWFATGFYCCGLCRRRKQGKAPQEAKTNGASQKTNGTPQKASLEELVSLLEGSKKK